LLAWWWNGCVSGGGLVACLVVDRLLAWWWVVFLTVGGLIACLLAD